MISPIIFLFAFIIPLQVYEFLFYQFRLLLAITFQVVSNGKVTIGQRCRKIAREVLHSMLELGKRLFMEGRSTDEVLDMLMPA